jgi:pimeloyl-ACP methyl ester carboxylesterase
LAWRLIAQNGKFLAGKQMAEAVSVGLAATDEKQVQAALPPLVLVHGIKGSHLRRKGCCGRRAYLSVEALLFNCCGCDQFPLPWKYDQGIGDSDLGTEKQYADDFESDGTILDVTCCGCIPASQMYSKTLKWAEKAGRRVCCFDYDWRRSPKEAGSKLERFLEAILRHDESGWTGGVQVICHSNGALVTFPVLNRRPELFHSVLFAAGALRGGVGFIRDLSIKGLGNKMAFNSTMMTPKHWIGWTSGYYFMPTLDELAAEGRPHLVEADGVTPVAMNFHDVSFWEQNQLGPFDPRSGCRQYMDGDPANKLFFEETLKRCLEYKQLMKCDASVTYPPLAVLASDSVTDTTTTWRRPSPESPFAFDDKAFPPLTSPGDGRICLNGSCMPPDGVPVLRKVVSHESHTGVATDVANIGPLLDALIQEAQSRGVTRGAKSVSHEPAQGIF